MRAPGPADDSALVDAYLRHYATKDHSLLWAFIKVNDIALEDAERGLRVTLALVAQAPDAQTLSYVAAGPLEEILEVHGAALIAQIEGIAKLNAKLRTALSRVDSQYMNEDVRIRLRRAVAGDDRSLGRP
jgi:hypothetical protein